MTIGTRSRADSLWNAPPWEITKWTIKIVQDCYPDRLHAALMVAAPSLFWVAWKAASVLIDPVTREKVVWIPDGHEERQAALREYIPLGQLEQAVGGTGSGSYDAAEYLASDPLRALQQVG